MQLYETTLSYPAPNAVAFSPNGRHLAVGGGGAIGVIDTLTGGVTTFALGESYWTPAGLGFASDGGLVTSYADAIWEYYPSDDRPGRRWGAPGSGPVVSAPDGKVIFAAARDDKGFSRIERWDGATMKPLPGFGRHRGRLVAIAVSADGKRFAGVGGKWVRTWNLAGDEPPARATCQIKTAGWAKVLALSKDGGLLAAAVRNRVVVWDARTGAERFHHTRHSRAVNAVAVGPVRPVLVSGGNDGLVFINDAETGKERRRLEWGIGEVIGLAFAPDGLRCAATGRYGKVVVWDVDE